MNNLKEQNSSDGTWQLGDERAARWIFPARPAGTVNQVVDFLHVFACDGRSRVPAAELWISADTDFVVWLNGRLIGHGQYANYPDRKTYERLALGEALRESDNTLAVTVFYNGRDSSVYRRGAPGLLFEVRAERVLAASGTATRCRPSPCYHSGPIAIVSHQLSYTFGYDARGDDGFNRDGYRAGEGWTALTDMEAQLPVDRMVLGPRPVARLEDGGCTPAQIRMAGVFRYDLAKAEADYKARAVKQTAAGLLLEDGVLVSPAWQMQYAQLTAGSIETIAGVGAGCELHTLPDGLRVAADLAGQDGIYLVFDLGREEAGYLELELTAPGGTMVDVGYGEHLDDGRARTYVGIRSFGGRYVCRDGRQTFTHHFLRWAGRYLQVYVQGGAFTLHRLALQRRDYPVQMRGILTTGQPLHGRLLEVGCRTLRLCMHEHYEDTPWREQALYANDARTQALCGYYAFGETAMPAASFTLLGQGVREDGFLYLTAPARQSITIPSFTLVWMLAVRDHFLYSGDDTIARAFLPQMLGMLRAFLAERRDGLLPLRQAEGVWHFYDWSAGMSGYKKTDFANGLLVDAPLNCFLILALEAVRDVVRWCGAAGDEELAAAAAGLRQGVAECFWDAGEGAFRTHAQTQTLTELTQALAVLAGVGDEAQRERALARLARSDSGLAKPGLSQAFYTFEALMTRKAQYGRRVLADIETDWGKMLDAGATTFWETIKGGSDFSNAGSLCHGWSAVPVYVLYHDVLGIRPLEPGFRTFAVDPLPGVIANGSGTVPVPGGAITLRWQTDHGAPRYELKAPKSCRAVKSGVMQHG